MAFCLATAGVTMASSAVALDIKKKCSESVCAEWEIKKIEGKTTLSIDISNTSSVGYHFDNRNDKAIDANTQTLNPADHVDDNYGEWLNRLYVRARYWKLSFGLRLDSAVYFNTMDRADAQQLIVDELGSADLSLENRFGRELHSRYTSLIYPAKLWLGFKTKGFNATLGDFYAHLGRGLVFSVRKIDEVGVDTTVRGGKLRFKQKVGGVRVEGMVFGGQVNPVRLDFPTGRVLHGNSPLFFGFPSSSDFSYYQADGADFVLKRDLAKLGIRNHQTLGAQLHRRQRGRREFHFWAETGPIRPERCRAISGRSERGASGLR